MKQLIIFLILLAAIGLAFAENPYLTVVVQGITLNYRVTPDMQNLDCQVIGNTTGWVAVGFAPTDIMANANIIIGYNAAGVTNIRDDFGTSSSTHSPDTSLGGTNNVIAPSSTEIDGVTQLNFLIPLNSGDVYDRVLQIGQTYNIIMAMGANSADNYTGSHVIAGIGSITLVEPTSASDNIIVQPATGLNLDIAPNPFGSYLGIKTQSKSAGPVFISLYDSKGREIRKAEVNGNSEINLNVDDLSAGIYFIKASGTDGNIARKVLKIR